MAKNKRSDFTDEQLESMVSKRVKKFYSLNEAKKHAKEELSRFIIKNHNSLNDIWTLFKRSPECFIFDEIVADIKDEYLTNHVSMSTDKYVQEENMHIAVERMQTVAKKIYIDLLESDKNEKEKQSVEKLKEDIEKENNMSYNNRPFFDDDIEVKSSKVNTTGLVSKTSKKFKITPEMQKMFILDDTPIDAFKPSCGDKLLKYFKNVRGFRTFGDYIKSFADLKERNAIYQKGGEVPQEYEEFRNKVMEYITSKMENIQKVSKTNKLKQKSKPAKKDSKVKKLAKIKTIEELNSIDASKFEKDSKSMEEISQMVSELLSNLTDEYFNAGLLAEEVDIEIAEQIKRFRALVDKKRAEIERKVAASKIKAKIADGVKYKNKSVNNKDHGHNHNPFVNEDTFNV